MPNVGAADVSQADWSRHEGSVANVGVSTWNLVRILAHLLGGPPSDWAVGDYHFYNSSDMLLGCAVMGRCGSDGSCSRACRAHHRRRDGRRARRQEGNVSP